MSNQNVIEMCPPTHVNLAAERRHKLVGKGTEPSTHPHYCVLADAWYCLVHTYYTEAWFCFCLLLTCWICVCQIHISKISPYPYLTAICWFPFRLICCWWRVSIHRINRNFLTPFNIERRRKHYRTVVFAKNSRQVELDTLEHLH